MGRYHGFVGPGATLSIEPVQERARTVLGRLKQEMVAFVNRLLARAREFLKDAVMRLWSVKRKITEAVVPLARKMASELGTHLLGQVQVFWRELGRSLQQLPLQTRREIVDGPWADLRRAIHERLLAARKEGVDQVDGWFSRAHRAQGIQAFENTFDPMANEVMRQVDASYQAAMR